MPAPDTFTINGSGNSDLVAGVIAPTYDKSRVFAIMQKLEAAAQYTHHHLARARCAGEQK